MKHIEIEYLFDELDEDVTGVTAISLVETPAHRAEFIAMSEAEEVMMSALDEDKRLAIGPVLMPGKVKGNPLKGKKGSFTAETISKLMKDYAKHGKNANTTFDHNGSISDCYTVSNWQVDRTKGVMAGYGFDSGENKVPDGTWMTSMYVGHDETWKDIKFGNIKGFSIEGKLSTREVAMSDFDSLIEKSNALYQDLLKDLKE